MEDPQVTTQTKRTELAGDPYGGLISKKLGVLGTSQATIAWLLYSDKLEPLAGSIIMGALGAMYLLVQGVADALKEWNRPETTRVTTVKARRVPIVEPAELHVDPDTEPLRSP